MFRHLRFTYSLALAAMALVAVAGEALAQTPEGTVITNTATATYTDANNNPYTAVSGSVSVTVGFKAGLTVTANTPTPSSASPSTADTMTFTAANVGNGTDSVTISENISVAGVITVTGYRYGATTYGTLAALNTALASVAIAQGGSITLKIVYNVASGQGGVSTVYTLTVNSRRTPATSGNAASTVTPATTYAATTTPDGGQNVQRLPGNGYSFTFSVGNNGNGNDNFDVIATSPGSPVITLVSVHGYQQWGQLRVERAGDRRAAGAGDLRLDELEHRMECLGERADRDCELHGHRRGPGGELQRHVRAARQRQLRGRSPMRLGTPAVERRRFARRGLAAAVWAAAFVFAAGLLAAPALQAQGTPAGTQVSNWATLSFTLGGTGFTAPSDTVAFLVGQVAGVTLQPPRATSAAAGAVATFAHTLTNVGNGADSFTVAAVSKRGWPVTLYRDANGNGVLDGGDALLTGPVPLVSGAAASLLARVAGPGGPSVGRSDTITVTATSQFNPAVSSPVQDRLDVSAAGATTISLTKQVDRLTAVAGDVLAYTLNYPAAGPGAVSRPTLPGTIPTGAVPLAGTLRLH